MLQGRTGDINEMNSLGGRGDSDPANKVQLPPKPGWTPGSGEHWAKAESRAELGRAAGRKKQNQTGPNHIWNDFFAEGIEDKPPALGVCIYSKIPCNATESFILHPPDLHSCCWHKNQLPCCVALIEAPLLLLPEHINAFKKLISPKLLPGHVLRR